MNIVLIAEKPSVARTYAEALDLKNEKKSEGYIEGDSNWDGNHYFCTWSIGHLVTLSYPDKYDEKYKNWNLDDLPFLPKTYKYEVIKSVATQYKIVKELYNRSDINRIIYGGDSGREGAYIQALIRMLAKNNGHCTEMMLWIDSQTKEEIRKGLTNLKPFSKYEPLIMAGYMRAIEDYAFGLNYSRALTKKFGGYYNSKTKSDKYKAISVGRVMTCVLGMVVDRENAIKNFKETLFYKISADCRNSEFEFNVDWLINEKSVYYNSPLLYENKGFLKQEDANEFIAKLAENPHLAVEDITEKTEKKKPPLLFNLAELQNECSKRFKISPNETLEVAQKLYDLKLTTYPRTDARYLSTAISKEIINNLKGLAEAKDEYNKKFIDQIINFGMYDGLEKTQYCNDSKITDHYAIIPTGYTNTGDLSELEMAIYHLIVDRFVAIFLPNAEYNVSTGIFIHESGERFKIVEKSLIKTGFLEVLKRKAEEDEEDLDGVKLSDYIAVGDVFDASFITEEGKTSPPKRYTSGSMILAMENAGNLIEDEELRAQIKGSGIGTSATRAGILEKLKSPTVGYIAINKKTQVITPTEDGYAVYDIVKQTIPQFLSPKMTASWEKGLTKIEEGTTTREEYTKILEKEIEKTIQKIKDIKTPETETFTPRETGSKCPFCGETIVTAKSGYKCKNNKYKGDNSCPFFIGFGNISEENLEALVTEGKTPVIDGFKSKAGKNFSAALKLNQEEKKIEFDFGDSDSGKIKIYDDTGLNCPYCGEPIVAFDKGFKCKNNKYKDEHSCPFYVGQIAGKTITKDILEQLLSYGKTDILSGFKKKSGTGTFKAALVLNKDEKKVGFDFPPREQS